jgi:hypothetical protein
VILNRLYERVRGRAPSVARGRRVPVVLVPGMFGTRLVDERRRVLWGTTTRLYFGPSIAGGTGVRTDGVLDELTLIPGLLGYDCYGGLTRFLDGAGLELRWFAYDWRLGVVDAAGALARFVENVRAEGHDKVDLVAISTGGQIARYFLAHGGIDVLGGEKPASGAGAAAVRRMIYVGTPQRGTFDALASLYRGFCFAPGGKQFDGREAALCQTSLDALPHPDESVFVDERGRPVARDLYDPATWRDLGLGCHDVPGFGGRLARAQRLHRALDRPFSHPSSTVIGARHLATPARVVVAAGRARVPFPKVQRNPRDASIAYVPGDGELPESSVTALPDLDPRRVHWVTPRAHNRMATDPEVRRLILATLLASS